MNFYKKALLLMALFPSTMILRAESSVITIWMKNGSSLTTSFEKYPRLVSMGASSELKSDDQVVEIHQEDLKQITFGAPTDVQLLQASGTAKYIMEDNYIYVSGEQPNSEVSLYETDGKLLKNAQVAADGSVTLSLPNQKKGVFLLKSNSINVKVLKK